MSFMPIHEPSIMLVLSVVSIVMSGVVLLTWAFNRKLTWLGDWALSSLGGPLIVVAILLRSKEAQLLSVWVTNLVYLWLPYLMWTGCRVYVGLRRPPWSRVFLLSIAYLAIVTWFTLVQPDHEVRVLIQSLVSATVYTMAARTLLMDGWQPFQARQFLGLLTLLHALMLLLRPLANLVVTTDQGFRLYPPIPVLFEGMIFFMLLCIGYLLLVIDSLTDELRHLAKNDPLTQAFNRRAFLDLLDKANSQAKRRDRPLTLILIDLDHFKRINDTWGHRAGDHVLQHFATLVNVNLRQGDVLGRLGGEEFCIFLPETSVSEASDIAERIRAQCERARITSGRASVTYTVSIGAAQVSPGETSEQAIHRADQAMYEAKRSGRNRVKIASVT